MVWGLPRCVWARESTAPKPRCICYLSHRGRPQTTSTRLYAGGELQGSPVWQALAGHKRSFPLPDFIIHPTPKRIVYPFFFEAFFSLYLQISLCPILVLSLWTFPISSSGSSSSDCCLRAFFPSGSWHSSHSMASSGYPIHPENLATSGP